MEGMLEPEEVEESLGMAEVRQTFRASRIGTIAGCHVVQGKITRNAKVRLVREGTIVYDGAIASLKRFKDDVQRGRGGLRVRDRARELPGREGRRRAGGLRDPQGRAESWSSVGERRRRALPGRTHDPSSFAGQRQPEGQAQGAAVGPVGARAAGSAHRSPRSTTRTCGSAPRSPPGSCRARPARSSTSPTRSSAFCRPVPGGRARGAAARVLSGPRLLA